MCDGRSKVTHAATKRGYPKQRTPIYDIGMHTDSRVGKKPNSTLSALFREIQSTYILIYNVIYY